MKEIISALCVVLSFVGYAPYLRDTAKGKTKPHMYSWVIWGLLTLIIGSLQLSKGAGVGAAPTLAAGSICFIIVSLGLRNEDKDITLSDTLFLALALVGLALWLVVNRPVLSIILLVTVDMLGFIPTLRKSWHKPREETLFTYALGAFRHGLSILALEKLTFVTVLFPAAWVVANSLFSLTLIVRRRLVVATS